MKRAVKTAVKAVIGALKPKFPNVDVTHNEPCSDGQNGSLNVKLNDPEHEIEDVLHSLRDVMKEHDMDSDGQPEDPDADFGLNLYWDMHKKFKDKG